MTPDDTKWEPDASERQKLTVHAPHNFEEGVRIEPFHEGRWYVCRCDLAKLTTIPATPAARAGGLNRPQLSSLSRPHHPQAEPEPLPPPEPELAKAEPTRWQRDRTIKAIRSLHPRTASVRRASASQR